MKLRKLSSTAKPASSAPPSADDPALEKSKTLRRLIGNSRNIARMMQRIVADLRQPSSQDNQSTKPKQEFTNKKEQYFKGLYAISKQLDVNIENLREIFGESDDMILREFIIDAEQKTKAFICLIDGLSDKRLIDEYILKPLMVNIHVSDRDHASQDLSTNIKEHVLNAVEIWETHSFDEVINDILAGNTALFIDGYDKVLLLSSVGGKTREITEPGTEVVVRGSREGFVESLRVNTSLLRRKVKNPNLMIEAFRLGKQTHTDINIVYLKGIANPKIIQEVKTRLNAIDTDSIITSGDIEKWVEDHPLSCFATVGNSERPDKVIGKILEGRVAILTNGTPFVLTVPYLFIENFQVPEDYANKFYFTSLIRLVRLLAFLITLTIPALFVAVETYHQEMLPSVLLITAAAAREGIPFPSFIETLLMLVVFELLRESGVRLPRQVGQAVSIVGALVVGDAAVRAGIISAPMVIIGSMTAIASYINPALLDSALFFRLFLLFLSGILGLYGFIVGIIVLLAHICSLRSFGVPYLAPLAPLIVKDLKDSLIQTPIWLKNDKPKSTTWKSTNEQDGESS